LRERWENADTTSCKITRRNGAGSRSVRNRHGRRSYIRDAAREATRAGDIDLLCVLAFVFDPQVVGAGDDGYITRVRERRCRATSRLPVLLVRMNADLVMGRS